MPQKQDSTLRINQAFQPQACGASTHSQQPSELKKTQTWQTLTLWRFQQSVHDHLVAYQPFYHELSFHPPQVPVYDVSYQLRSLSANSLVDWPKQTINVTLPCVVQFPREYSSPVDDWHE